MPAPKCGTITGDLGKPGRRRGERERIPQAEIERGRQAELPSDADGQHAAVDEHHGAVGRGGGKDIPDPLIVQAVSVHRREQADAAQAQAAEGPSQPAPDVPLRRVEHEEPDEPRGMPAHRRADGLLVAGDARDDRGPGDAVAIELRRPAIRELLGASRIVPPEAVRYCHGPIGVGQIGKAPR